MSSSLKVGWRKDEEDTVQQCSRRGYELTLLVFVEGFLIATLSGDCH